MTKDQTYAVRGDRALSSADDDRLGFQEVARRIALSLVDRASEDGLVVGVEGAWGSGKSSLLYLIADELRRLPKTTQPTVINFRPWLIGNRDALITSLFGEFSKQLDKIALEAGDATPVTLARAKAARDALRSFMNGLSRVGSVAEVVGDASGIGPLKWGGKGISALGKLAAGKAAPPQLADLKDRLAKTLRDLGHRIVVTVDDVDRLEPAEAIEILRLVRSVVDLPNVIYLLCYDSQILAHSIERAAGISSGSAYLEKIVQLTVMVPKPEPLQLRQWFTDELHGIASAKEEDERTRLAQVIDYEGGRQLRTPRSVMRALDAVRFLWPALRDECADLADLVWLQLIKDGNPKLYRWIETYCATMAAVAVGVARIDDGEKAGELAHLMASVDDGCFDNMMYRHHFAEQLPGADTDFAKDGDKFLLFQRVNDWTRERAMRSKRLSSPDHYRLYFALGLPSHAPTQAQYAALWHAATDGPQPASDMLLALFKDSAGGSLSKGDVLLDRIKTGAHETLTPVQCRNLLLGFARAMDEIYLLRPFDGFWVNSPWDRAERLVPPLITKLAADVRAATIEAMFSEGIAIGWLTTLLRSETFAHGRFGDRPRREEEWLFTNPELDRVTELMLPRYRAMSIADVFGAPSPINILFAWQQAGDKAGPRDLVQSGVTSDVDLVVALESLCGSVQTSNRGKVETLKRHNLEPFFDYDGVRARVLGLKDDPALVARAGRLMEAFENGDEF